MRGSSGIPKGDINSTLAPTTTADTTVELKNSTEPYGRTKSRIPPSVREKERAKAMSSDNSSLPAKNMNQHTAPVTTSSEKKPHVKNEDRTNKNNRNNIAELLVLRIQPALVEKDLDQLEIAIKGLEENNLRLDTSPLAKYSEVNDFVRTGALKVITLNNDAVSDQAEDLLIRMIRLGVRADREDASGNTMLTYACKLGRLKLVKVLLDECRTVNKNRINIFGQNAAVMAYKYGNAHLYSVLEQAGISPHPENPAIKFYLESINTQDDGSSDSDTDTHADMGKYLELFKQNNFLNLPDENGLTLLFHAVIKEDVEFISFLCNQQSFLNVALRDVNQKSVFDYIRQIQNPAKREAALELIRNKAKQTAWLSQMATNNF